MENYGAFNVQQSEVHKKGEIQVNRSVSPSKKTVPTGQENPRPESRAIVADCSGVGDWFIPKNVACMAMKDMQHG